MFDNRTGCVIARSWKRRSNLFFRQRLLRCAAQKQNPRRMLKAPRHSGQGRRPRPGIQEEKLDSRLRGNDDPGDVPGFCHALTKTLLLPKLYFLEGNTPVMVNGSFATK